jgi:hypothetical protein
MFNKIDGILPQTKEIMSKGGKKKENDSSSESSQQQIKIFLKFKKYIHDDKKKIVQSVKTTKDFYCLIPFPILLI